MTVVELILQCLLQEIVDEKFLIEVIKQRVAIQSKAMIILIFININIFLTIIIIYYMEASVPK